MAPSETADRRPPRGLRALLHGLSDRELVEAVAYWRSGDLAHALLASAKARALRRTAATERRPASRIERSQAWMLARYEAIGRRDEVFDELVELRKTDPALHAELIGDHRQLTFETVRRWWRRIPEERRQAAKERHNARPAAERRRNAARRRVGRGEAR